MQVLITGISGYVGAALAPELQRRGHRVRGLSRDPSRVSVACDELVTGDAGGGMGLRTALDGVDVAFFLVHSMDTAAGPGWADVERRTAEGFAAAAGDAGVRRIVFLGGLAPARATDRSPHLASRLAVERILLDAVPDALALRASLVVGGGSRSFRLLVRLVERLPVLPLPAWRENRTMPIDGRDVVAALAACLDADPGPERSLDIAGPDEVTYGALMDRLADALWLERPTLPLQVSLTSVAAPLVAALTGEDPALVGPLMRSLDHSLLPRTPGGLARLGVRAHSLDSAIGQALREMASAESAADRPDEP